MLDPDLASARQKIVVAQSLEELLGEMPFSFPPEALVRKLRERTEEFLSPLSPARYHHPFDKEAAAEASAAIHRLLDDGIYRATRGLYGLWGRGITRPPHASRSFQIENRRYYLGPRTEGSDGALFEGYVELNGRHVGFVTVKRARNEEESLLLEDELHILGILHGKEVPQWKHLPRVVDTFRSEQLQAVVYRGLQGARLSEVRTHRLHMNGVDPRHMIWMLDRMLSCIGYAHQRGIVHGAISPEQIFIEPTTHNVVLFGWGTAIHEPAITGEFVRAASTHFTSPEVQKHGAIGPWSDIYSIGKVMIWLLGGDPAIDSIPSGIEPPLVELLRSMVHTDPLQRPSDAWELHAAENRIKDALWRRQFLHFDIS